MHSLAPTLSEAVASLDPQAASQVAVVFTKAIKDSKNAFLFEAVLRKKPVEGGRPP